MSTIVARGLDLGLQSLDAGCPWDEGVTLNEASSFSQVQLPGQRCEPAADNTVGGWPCFRPCEGSGWYRHSIHRYSHYTEGHLLSSGTKYERLGS